MLWLMDSQFLAVSAAPADELHVCLSGCPYASVQAAVDAANDGDVIKVAAGTYTGVSAREGVTQVVYISKSVTIQGGYTPGNWITPDPEANITTLDAQGHGRVLYVIGGNGSVIDGLHITGGNAFGQLGEHLPSYTNGSAGGGVYVHGAVDPFGAEFTLTNNHIYENIARHGGGVYMSFCCSNATLRGNTFTANNGQETGGGVLLHAGAAVLTDNVFDANSAGRGGGFYMHCNGTEFRRNTFVDNAATTAGGGLFLDMVCGEAKLYETFVISNTSERGGGLAIASTGLAGWGEKDVSLSNTVIADNQAYIEGGGIYIESVYSLQLLHTTLARNGGGDGSGVRIGASTLMGPGSSTVALTNTILANQSIGLGVTDGNTVTVNGILWYSTPITISQSPSAIVSVQNQITGDPAFLTGGDYHIGATSAARDAGVDTSVPIDLDGQIRPMGLGYDLGAYEYPAPALSASNRAFATFVNRGQATTYTLGVTNIGAGSVPASGVVLTDTLDSWQRATGAVASLGSCAITNPGWGGAVVCTIGALTTGASATITLTVEVSASAPMGQAMMNAVVARANETRSSAAQATTYAQDCHARINSSPMTYASVQAAVDAANPGDVVKVAGTCLGVGERDGLRQQVYLDKGLAVQGGYTLTNWVTPDPAVNPTTLDALGAGRVIYITGAISPAIEGLRLTNGDASGLGPFEWGRTWNAGNGLYVVTATATISHNWIYNNIYSDEYTLGGGVFLHNSDSAVSDNAIFSNTARYGGGILSYSSAATVRNNMILSNIALHDGGGICVWDVANVLTGNVIRGNTAQWSGGGINVDAPGSTLINNIVSDNFAGISGSGMTIFQDAQLWHTTLAGNTGGDGSGIYVANSGASTHAAFTNTVMAQHSVGISVTAGNTITVNGVLWSTTPITVSHETGAMVSVQNPHTGDPAFVDSGGGDYHIGAASAAIDQGVPAGILTDIDGDTRPRGLGFDLGADEFWASMWYVYLPLVLK
jgi:uncharacterized repeat protein (TIGR01451 family)